MSQGNNYPPSGKMMTNVGAMVGGGTGGVKPTSPKGGIVSSNELLNLLRLPAGGSGKDSVRGGTGEVYGNLEAEFARLYVGSGGLPGGSRVGSKATTPDNYGMTGLADLVSMALNNRLGPVQFGLDLRTTGLNLEQPEQLSRNFVSPWHDPTSSLGGSGPTGLGNLDSVLPACYNVQASPAVNNKIPGFADETLFYMFYAMPGDRMQDLAARELSDRNWRFHRELKIWLLMLDDGATNTGRSGKGGEMMSPAMPMLGTGPVKPPPNPNTAVLMKPTGAPRVYTIFDPQSWSKISKELPVRAEQLEDRFAKQSGSSAPASTPVLFNSSVNSRTTPKV